MIRTLIIDDEPHIRDTLAKILARHCPQTRVMGTASDVAGGIEAIKRLKPSLVLLDIHLPDGTGFDVLHALERIDFRVIFISAMDKETIQAFRLSGMEYLLKPVSPIDLSDAVKRVIMSDERGFTLQLRALEMNVK
ncbi:MAG: response regulator [Bacteroidales bacterium]|nr:response regulator [Lentimicrobiaceae bacterium]MDD5695714.1 response regulator [Bacteroidales bacterium]